MTNAIKGFLAAAMLFAASPAIANDQAAAWMNLLQKAYESQDITQIADGAIYSTLTRFNGSETTGDKTKSHKVDYFSIVSFMNGAGQLSPVYVDVVSEDWKLDGDIWTVEQWIFRSSLSGTVSMSRHAQLVERIDGRVLDLKEYPTTDEEKKAAFEVLKKDWMNFANKK